MVKLHRHVLQGQRIVEVLLLLCPPLEVLLLTDGRSHILGSYLRQLNVGEVGLMHWIE